MSEVRGIRILEDINHTLYEGNNNITVVNEGLTDEELLKVQSLNQLVMGQQVKGGSRFSLSTVLNIITDVGRDIASPLNALREEIPIEREVRGIKLLSNCVDCNGQSVKVTLFSNIPYFKADRLSQRLKDDGIWPYLDQELPFLLRPYESIPSVLFKYSAVNLFKGERVFLVDDDPYIGEVIKRGYGAEVYNPSTDSNWVRDLKSQSHLILPDNLPNRSGKVTIQTGGALDIYHMLLSQGYVKSVRY